MSACDSKTSPYSGLLSDSHTTARAVLSLSARNLLNHPRAHRNRMWPSSALRTSTTRTLSPVRRTSSGSDMLGSNVLRNVAGFTIWYKLASRWERAFWRAASLGTVTVTVTLGSCSSCLGLAASAPARLELAATGRGRAATSTAGGGPADSAPVTPVSLVTNPNSTFVPAFASTAAISFRLPTSKPFTRTMRLGTGTPASSAAPPAPAYLATFPLAVMSIPNPPRPRVKEIAASGPTSRSRTLVAMTGVALRAASLAAARAFICSFAVTIAWAISSAFLIASC